jgi:hypothetical protein
MNLTTLHKKFDTQAKCIAYLEKLRRGKERACTHCDDMNDNLLK